MGTKVVRFHPEAEQEYLAALAWYRERSLTAATDFELANALEQSDRGIAGKVAGLFRRVPQIYSASVPIQHHLSGVPVRGRCVRGGPWPTKTGLLESSKIRQHGDTATQSLFPHHQLGNRR